MGRLIAFQLQHSTGSDSKIEITMCAWLLSHCARAKMHILSNPIYFLVFPFDGCSLLLNCLGTWASNDWTWASSTHWHRIYTYVTHWTSIVRHINRETMHFDEAMMTMTTTTAVVKHNRLSIEWECNAKKCRTKCETNESWLPHCLLCKCSLSTTTASTGTILSIRPLRMPRMIFCISTSSSFFVLWHTLESSRALLGRYFYASVAVMKWKTSPNNGPRAGLHLLSESHSASSICHCVCVPTWIINGVSSHAIGVAQ